MKGWVLKGDKLLKENQRLIIEGIIKCPSETGGLPHLLGNKCKSCGKVFFPKRLICPNCFTDTTLVEFELSPKGKVYTYTIVHYPSPAGIEVPYAYGYVDLPEDNIRVFSLFTESNPAKLEIGMDVELVVEEIRTDKDGTKIIGYKFRPKNF